jgi:hypothetical protein
VASEVGLCFAVRPMGRSLLCGVASGVGLLWVVVVAGLTGYGIFLVVVVGLFINLWIFVVAGCFGRVFKFVLLWWFSRFSFHVCVWSFVDLHSRERHMGIQWVRHNWREAELAK